VAELTKDASRAEVHLSNAKVSRQSSPPGPAECWPAPQTPFPWPFWPPHATLLSVSRPDRLSDLRGLLAVIMVEVGAPWSLAVGMALSGSSGGPT
jgi:hypothetical protein